MAKAARAIIIKGDKLLVMHRDKSGAQYFTLVGGRVKDNESMERGLVREVKEETGLNVTSARLVYVEEHAPPYNEQYIYLCEATGAHDSIAIQTASEEGFMNQIGINNHQPMWVDIRAFPRIQFRTPQLQAAITEAFRSGFPTQPIKL
jgi:ADP-ribose pyrophosphatase YjhB (NUDIX family)